MAEAPAKYSRRETFDDVHLDPKYKVSYITDVEGNWEYFCNYVDRAEGLRWAPREAGELVGRLELLDGWRFIFGGDAVDKGSAVGGSIRFIVCLASLKKRYPDRVTIILGNRDLNKMRLTSELHPSQLEPSLLAQLPGPKWLPAGPKRVTPEAHLRKVAAAALGVGPEVVTMEQLQEHNTMANRLRYILKETMGADGELERRIGELAAIEAEGGDVASLTSTSVPLPPSGETADVDRAVASFVKSVEPGGCMRELLELGELGVVMGDTLFVHGGLSSREYTDSGEDVDCYGHVPGRPDRIERAVEWLTALRAWKTAQLDEWASAPCWRDGAPTHDEPDGIGRGRGGQALMDYVVVRTGPSVVLGRHLDSDSMPQPVPYGLMVRCNRSGITRLVVGHTPHGNCPTAFKSSEVDAQLEVVMNDTSFSDMKAVDNRGAAVSEFVLFPSCDARVHGVLDDGAAYEYTLGDNGGDDAELVGKLERSLHAARKKNGEPKLRFVKAKMATGDYLLCHVNGFKYEYEYLSELDTITAVGAVEAHDTMRASMNNAEMMERASRLGIRDSQTLGVTSSRNGFTNWAENVPRHSVEGA